MNVIINGKTEVLPATVDTLLDLANHHGIPLQGTAVALNGALIKSDKWGVTSLKELDQILIISAAYGG